VLLSLIDPLIQQADSGFRGAVEHLAADPRRAFRAGIATFVEAFAAHPAMARAGADALNSSAEIRTIWTAFMQKWIHQTAALVSSERDRGAAPDTVPALNLATSLNLMNERMIIATLSDEEGAVPRADLVETLTHIWLASIYG
jgi:TetR/AcrR family transcriptional regulator, ethionamide resistance regulator